MNTLRSILEELHPEVDFDREGELVDRGILDSFDMVTIMAEIDGELDIAIPAEEMTRENFNSLQALQALVSRLAGR